MLYRTLRDLITGHVYLSWDGEDWTEEDSVEGQEMLKQAGYETEGVNVENQNLAELVEGADLVMLVIAGKRVGLGRDMQKEIVDALRKYAPVQEETTTPSVNSGD